MKFKLNEAKELVRNFGLELTHSRITWQGIHKDNLDSCGFRDDEEFYIDNSIVVKNNKLNRKLYPKSIQYKNYLIVDKDK